MVPPVFDSVTSTFEQLFAPDSNARHQSTGDGHGNLRWTSRHKHHTMNRTPHRPKGNHQMTKNPGAFENDTFVMPIRVYYADTDAGGIVYHSVYLDMAERCRTEMLRALSWPLIGADGSNFVVRRAQLEWHSPAFLEDLLTCVTHVQRLKAASVTMHQGFYRDGATLAEATVTLAYVSKQIKPIRMPKALRNAFGACTRPAQD
jgi:acyl-CoA thioester hydrolase